MGEELMETPLAALPLAAIDFESAGAAPGETDQPVQVGIVRVGSLSGKEECFHSYIASAHPVRWNAARVHGITTAMLKDAPPFASLWPDLRRLLAGSVIVGHNPATERRFLSFFPGHGFGPWLDTLALARQAMPTLQDHSLSSVCDALGAASEPQRIAPGRRWHDALFDAAASLSVLRAIIHGLHMEQVPLRSLRFALMK